MTVLQGFQSRTFSYTSLGRLASATNPESGTTTYTYYDHGGLYQKMDARGATVTHTYDALLRLTNKTYTGVSSPAVSYLFPNWLNFSQRGPPKLRDNLRCRSHDLFQLRCPR
jgi:YD repeat-containing protein